MRLLKIGRDASCNIVLQSDKVSSLHAEITVLNNGDILLEDKNSRNGTFLMNKPIKPGTPVSVRRGDAIRFGDVELMWNQVPMAEDNSNFKALFGIGTNFRNEIQISGNTASRFHATLKISKDGKPYIQDHSKNGTTVNGTRIAFGQNVKIKRSDAIVCGGIPVDVKRFIPNSFAWQKAVGIVAIAAILLGVIWNFGFKGENSTNWSWGNSEKSDSELFARHKNSTAMVVGFYHYKVTAGDFDLSLIDFPSEVILDGFGLKPLKGNSPMSYMGTGFWISDDGKMITNLHIAKPWITDKETMEYLARACKMRMADLGSMVPQLNALLSEIKVEGVLDYIAVNPNGAYFDVDNLKKCRVLEAGDDINVDVALIQTIDKDLPGKNTTYVNTDSIVVQDADIKVGSHIYTIGYPTGTGIQELDSSKGILSFGRGGEVTQEPTEYHFGHNAATTGGASGSPVFDKRGYLIGVHNAGVRNTQGFNFAIKAVYVKEMLDKFTKKNE